MKENKDNKILAIKNAKLDTPQIRKINRKVVFDYIRECPGVTKAKLASALELSRPTISNIVDELESGKLICGVKDTTNTGGRNAMGYTCISEACYTVGLQLSGHHIRGIVLDLEGKAIEKICIREDFKVGEEYRKKIGEVYQNLIQNAGIKAADIFGTGVTVQALTDKEGTTVTYIPNKEKSVLKYDRLLKYIPGQKRLFHDLSALGYNEDIRIDENIFYLSINNRIGSMIIVDNQVYYGSNNRAGEVGHIQLQYGGRQCYCGNKGCFDAYCNTNVLRECANGNLNDFFREIDAGNEKYKACLKEYIEYMAAAIFSIHVIFDGVIIIGGEIGQYADYYLENVRDILDSKAFFPDEYASQYLFADKSGEYAIATGAAMYYNNHVLDQFE